MNWNRRIVGLMAAAPLAALTVAGAVTALASRVAAQTDTSERWIHVRVDNKEAKGEMVRVNVPLSLAEAILPAVDNGNLHHGRVRFGHSDFNGTDVHAILSALAAAKDGEFVTVQKTDAEVRVEKKEGMLLIHVVDKDRYPEQRVEVRVPMAVVNAMVKSDSDELDLVAGLRALAAQGISEIVTVDNGDNHVRVWLDNKNVSD